MFTCLLFAKARVARVKYVRPAAGGYTQRWAVDSLASLKRDADIKAYNEEHVSEHTWPPDSSNSTGQSGREVSNHEDAPPELRGKVARADSDETVKK